MADEKFRLPGSSYEQLTRIIRSYALMRGPVGPAEVGRPLGIDPTIVSRNNGFLLGAGIVEGGNQKALTELGRNLAMALEHDVDDDVRAYWRRVIEQTEFLGQLVSAVKIRNGMEGGALQSHVVYSARQPSSGPAKTGAGTVVEILRAAGVVEERDGKFVAIEDMGRPSPDRAPDTGPAAETESTKREAERRPREPATVVPVIETSGLSVQIRVNVDCSVEQLPDLAEKLLAFRRTLSETADAADSE